MPTLNLTSWAGIMAAGALIGTCWRSIAGFLTRLTYLVFGRAVLKQEVAEAVLAKVWQDGSRSPFRLRLFGGVKSYVFPRKRVEAVGYETLGRDPVLMWFSGIPVLVKNQTTWGGESNSNPTHFKTEGSVGLVQLWYLRGTLDIDLFIEEALVRFNARTLTVASVTAPAKRRFYIHRMSGKPQYGNVREMKDSAGESPSTTNADILEALKHGEMRLLTWTPQDLIERANDIPPFSLYPFTVNQLSVIDEVKTWLGNEMWFRSKGVPFRRGFLSFGPPGGGKSTFVKSLAIHFDLPLYTMDLSSYDNRGFTDDWQKAQQNSPAIVLLEDIDAHYVGRKYVGSTSDKHPHLTFDCLLNTISGVGISDGILLFITTNKVETLDPALGVPVNGDNRSSRPGRIDKAIHFGAMEQPQRLKLASFILADYPEVIESIVAAGEGEMAAQFQERCTQVALKAFWERAAVPVALSA